MMMMAPPRPIHNLEVFTRDAAGAYEVAPTILQNGHHYNIMKIRWIWNKQVLGPQIWLKIETDDDKFFTSKAVDPATADVSDCFGDRPERARKCWDAVESVKNVEYSRVDILTTTTATTTTTTTLKTLKKTKEEEEAVEQKKRKRRQDDDEEEEEDDEETTVCYIKKKKIRNESGGAVAGPADREVVVVGSKMELFEAISNMKGSKSGLIDIKDKHSLPRSLEQFANIMEDNNNDL